jgi:D-aminopeptidase
VLLGCFEVLLFDGFEPLAEVLVEDLEEEGDVVAGDVEGAEGYFEGLEVVELLRVVLEVVLLGGHGEAANGQIHHLNNASLTTSFTTFRYSYYHPRSQHSKLM